MTADQGAEIIELLVAIMACGFVSAACLIIHVIHTWPRN